MARTAHQLQGTRIPSPISISLPALLLFKEEKKKMGGGGCFALEQAWVPPFHALPLQMLKQLLEEVMLEKPHQQKAVVAGRVVLLSDDAPKSPSIIRTAHAHNPSFFFHRTHLYFFFFFLPSFCRGLFFRHFYPSPSSSGLLFFRLCIECKI
jgi:hypothetical protein